MIGKYKIAIFALLFSFFSLLAWLILFPFAPFILEERKYYFGTYYNLKEKPSFYFLSIADYFFEKVALKMDKF